MAEIEFPDRKAHRRRQRSGIGLVLGVLGVVLLIAVLARIHVTSKRDAALVVKAVPAPVVVKKPPPPKPRPAPAPPPERAVRMAAIHAALRGGDKVEIQKQVDGLQNSFRQSFPAAESGEAQRFEHARANAWDVPGIRAAAWLDRRNLFALVESADRRSQATIDAICKVMTPLASPMDVVVNLEFESPAADNPELLRRKCGDAVPAPEAKGNGMPGAADAKTTPQGADPKERDPVREESLRVLRDTTPEL